MWVIDEDAGGTATSGERWRAGAQLVSVMRAIEWEGDPVFDVSLVTDRRAAEISLNERKIALLLTIPPGFGQALLDAAAAARRGEDASPAPLSLTGDPSSETFVFAQNLVETLVREFARYVADRRADQASSWDAAWSQLSTSQTVSYEFLSDTGAMSDFDFGVPGVIVFGIMFVVVSTAMTMVRENVSGTLRRLRLTRLGARDMLLGVTLAQLVVGVVMVPLTFGAAVLMGFRGHGSLPLAMGVGLLLSLSATGLGMMVAPFARTDSEAANLSSAVGVFMVLVSGAMYPVPEVRLFTIAGRTIQIYDLLPPTHAAEALRQVLVKGQGVGAIGYELAAMGFLSVILLAAGMALYQRLQLRSV